VVTPHDTMWRDRHGVDVWELWRSPHEAAQFFSGEDFSEIFNQRIRDGCTRPLAG